MALDSINSNIHFQAAHTLSSQAAAKAQKEEKTKRTPEKKGIFASLFERSQAEITVTQDGFPIEIVDMETEEAAIWLRDQADIAADILKDHQTPDVFADYKKKVTQFLKFVTKNNLELKRKKRIGYRRNGTPLEPHIQINVINAKLDEMARWLINPANDIHRKTLGMLERINELKGLLVDLFAS
ncbi:MAG: DUF327 family protein [Treponema sp.]|nr:DUF327 family protein [Candidatus Treponema equi]